MRTIMVFGILILSIVLCLQSAQSAHYSDDRMGESSYSARDLASWLLEVAQRNEHYHKRNSEIINSLLGLPKILNDAGRK